MFNSLMRMFEINNYGLKPNLEILYYNTCRNPLIAGKEGDVMEEDAVS